MCKIDSASEEELGSSEESGKDWDELEEEARKGIIFSTKLKDQPEWFAGWMGFFFFFFRYW